MLLIYYRMGVSDARQLFDGLVLFACLLVFRYPEYRTPVVCWSC